MNRQKIALAAALGCAIWLYAMAARSKSVVRLPEEVASIKRPTAETLDIPEPEKNTKGDVAVEELPTGGESESESLELVFEPPFPDRVNLFQAPRRRRTNSSELAGQTESAVELLGFVNVEGQRVVLSIDGLISPLAEGSEQFGIEVISIKPPTVVLQRGRQRWQASLDN